MATTVAPEKVKAKIAYRQGILTILDGRTPEPVEFNADDPAEFAKTKATVDAFKAQGYLIAVGDVEVRREITPLDVNITVAAPLAGG